MHDGFHLLAAPKFTRINKQLKEKSGRPECGKGPCQPCTSTGISRNTAGSSRHGNPIITSVKQMKNVCTRKIDAFTRLSRAPSSPI